MKTYLTLFCAFLLLVSCETKKKDPNARYLTKSNGNLNTISVVVDKLLWESNVGEAIRNTFATPIIGLPQDEPTFKMRQIPPQVFDGFATKSRIILKIEKGAENASTTISKDVYAKPQTVAVIAGKTDQDIIAQLKNNTTKIIDAYNKEEVKEKQRRIKLSLLDIKPIESKLGFTIEIPSAYRISKSEDNFFWIQKNLTNSSSIGLMFYDVPHNTIKAGDSTVSNITTIRNLTTKTKIPGEDGIYMQVEDAYTPGMFTTIIDNKPAYEMRGVWEMVGFTMAGPFITYAIEDKVNKRYLIADGYVYAPSTSKRDYIFEIESIMKSITIK